jgi:hypothetical protein
MTETTTGTGESAVLDTWQGVEFLQGGSATQRQAYAVLRALGLPDVLARFDAVLVGALPLDLGDVGSDLDLVCNVQDLEGFQRVLKDLFSDAPGFWTIRKRVDGRHAVVAWFNAGKFGIGIFGEDLPVGDQARYRLTAVEDRLLRIGGEPLKQSVLDLIGQGENIESALSALLGFTGDPCEALLGLDMVPDIVLEALLESRVGKPSVNSD